MMPSKTDTIPPNSIQPPPPPGQPSVPPKPGANPAGAAPNDAGAGDESAADEEKDDDATAAATTGRASLTPNHAHNRLSRLPARVLGDQAVLEPDAYFGPSAAPHARAITAFDARIATMRREVGGHAQPTARSAALASYKPGSTARKRVARYQDFMARRSR